jgi:precorrin-2 dehydrogenase/sirohydrochlorin ferrochelatase
MNAFPAFFPLAGRRVAIVGAGEAAEAKVRLLDGAPAEVVRLSADEGADPAAYAGAVLAFVAGLDTDAARAAATAARAAHVPVNVTDRPELCDFTTPGIIDRGAVVVAVGTGGAAPLLASLLRADLEARLPEGIGALAGLLGDLQGEIRSAFPDLARRRAFLRAALRGPAAEAALAGDLDGAQARLRQGIADAGSARGALRLVDGAGPADLLTLRAARALGEADLLVVGPGADPAITVLARRDAHRVSDIALDDLQRRLEEGLQVVWIASPGEAPALMQQLEAAGIGAEVLAKAN